MPFKNKILKNQEKTLWNQKEYQELHDNQSSQQKMRDEMENFMTQAKYFLRKSGDNAGTI